MVADVRQREREGEEEGEKGARRERRPIAFCKGRGVVQDGATDLTYDGIRKNADVPRWMLSFAPTNRSRQKFSGKKRTKTTTIASCKSEVQPTLRNKNENAKRIRRNDHKENNKSIKRINMRQAGFSPHAHLISAWDPWPEYQLFLDRLFCKRIGGPVPLSLERHPPSIREVLSIKVSDGRLGEQK